MNTKRKKDITDLVIKKIFDITIEDINTLYLNGELSDDMMGKYEKEIDSLKKRVDNFIVCMEDEDHPLHWFPLDILPNEIVADLIYIHIFYINEASGDENEINNRKLLENMKTLGAKCDYSYFISEKIENKYQAISDVSKFPDGNTKIFFDTPEFYLINTILKIKAHTDNSDIDFQTKCKMIFGEIWHCNVYLDLLHCASDSESIKKDNYNSENTDKITVAEGINSLISNPLYYIMRVFTDIKIIIENEDLQTDKKYNRIIDIINNILMCYEDQLLLVLDTNRKYTYSLYIYANDAELEIMTKENYIANFPLKCKDIIKNDNISIEDKYIEILKEYEIAENSAKEVYYIYLSDTLNYCTIKKNLDWSASVFYGEWMINQYKELFAYLIVNLLIFNDEVNDKTNKIEQLKKRIELLTQYRKKQKETELNNVKNLKDSKDFNKNMQDIYDDMRINFYLYAKQLSHSKEIEGVTTILSKHKSNNSAEKKHIIPDKKKVYEYKDKDTDLKMYITEGKQVYNFWDKYYKLNAFIDFLKYDIRVVMIDLDSVILRKAVFTELFMDKSTYNRKSANKIFKIMEDKITPDTVRKVLSENGAEQKMNLKDLITWKLQTWYLDVKIVRGYFECMNMPKEYEAYMGLNNALSNLILETYNFNIRFREEYRIISENFVYLFNSLMDVLYKDMI